MSETALPIAATSWPLQMRPWRIAVIPKGLDNPFYFPTRSGCVDQSIQLSLTGDRPVDCIFIGPAVYEDDSDGSEQGRIVSRLLDERAVDAIAVAVRRTAVMEPIIERANREGIPLVTFDADSPRAQRIAYIGTDNYFFGQTIAKVLKQLEPNGGSFGTLTSAESANLHDRMNGFLDEMLKDGKWQQVEGSPIDVQSNHTKYLEGMQMFANAATTPTAIAPVMASTIQFNEWRSFVEEHARKNITLVSGDSSDIQLQFLERGYVSGLVGQMPYEMGAISVQVLYSILNGDNLTNDFFGTNVLTFIQVPLILPDLEVENNLIGNLYLIGFILFGVIAVGSLGVLVWMYRNRNVQVVKVSQPMFLGFILAGTVIMAASLIPLSFDDSREGFGHRQGTMICMSVPWFASTGFTITFAALFSKTMRVNKLFHNPNAYARIQVTAKDVLVPLIALLVANWAFLAWWTIQDPLIYTRQDLPGLDGWSRVIATYGACKSENVWRYLAPLVLVNLSSLVLANWQAYEARQIESEFAESKYIALTEASMLQAMLCGVPVLFVVRESPQAFYITLVFLLFTMSFSCLVLIFVPKIILAYHFTGRSDQEQRKYILSLIRRVTSQRQLQSTSARETGSLYMSDGSGFRRAQTLRERSTTPSDADGQSRSQFPLAAAPVLGNHDMDLSHRPLKELDRASILATVREGSTEDLAMTVSELLATLSTSGDDRNHSARPSEPGNGQPNSVCHQFYSVQDL